MRHGGPLKDHIFRDPLARGLIDALPCAVVLLSPALEIEVLNGPALDWVNKQETHVVGQRPGDALGCVSALAAEQGCGSGLLCGKCLLRTSALEVLAGRALSQREVRLTTRQDGVERERVVLLSASLFPHADTPYALLLLQEVTDLHRLCGLLSICFYCKKIRVEAAGEPDQWVAVDHYMMEREIAEFSHGICEDCIREHFPEDA